MLVIAALKLCYKFHFKQNKTTGKKYTQYEHLKQTEVKNSNLKFTKINDSLVFQLHKLKQRRVTCKKIITNAGKRMI